MRNDDGKLPRDSLERRARQRVHRKLGFYLHALVFAAVNLGLFVLHQAIGHPHRTTVLWGWGLGLLVHGLVTFIGLQGEGVRERMLREEIERMRQREGR